MRITAWYVLILGLTAGIVGVFFYVEIEKSLLASADLSLRAALAQAAAAIEDEGKRPAFRNKDDVDVVVRNRGRANFAVRLLDVKGRIVDGDGSYRDGPEWPPATEGFATVQGKGGSWRVVTEPILAKEEPAKGWIQAAEPINDIASAVGRLREVLLLAIPLMLLLAGAGGVLLVHEALKPISTVIATARSISSEDLSGRIAYDGPTDELAELASTFDRMIDRLQEGFNQERRFVADVSHELRTPLTAIKGQIEVALSRTRSEADYREVLSALSSESDRLIRLTNDLLLLSRIGLPNRTAAHTPVELPDLLLAVIDQIVPLADTKGITVFPGGISGSLQVVGDFDELVRLFLNLLDNAVKYTPEGGKIKVMLSRRSPVNAAVVIENTGPGFHPAHADRIFDRFYRVAADRSRDSGGSGLGLAIAREIVHVHGGTIRAHSVPGGPTTFTVVLPSVATE